MLALRSKEKRPQKNTLKQPKNERKNEAGFRKNGAPVETKRSFSRKPVFLQTKKQKRRPSLKYYLVKTHAFWLIFDVFSIEKKGYFGALFAL